MSMLQRNYLTDAERLELLQDTQRLSSALGPDERHVTTEFEWRRLSELEKSRLLVHEQMTASKRAAASRRCECACA